MDDESDLDSVSEKELLLEIFRQVRGVRRLLLFAVVVAPLLYIALSLLVLIANT